MELERGVPQAHAEEEGAFPCSREECLELSGNLGLPAVDAQLQTVDQARLGVQEAAPVVE
jgi:hypothetical protein